MSSLRKIRLAGLYAALSVGMFPQFTTAHAQDVAESNAADFDSRWSGAYAGVQGGYSWGNVDISSVTVKKKASKLSQNSSADMNGWLAGAFVGYNHQIENLVVSVEADIQWTDIDSGRIRSTNSYVMDMDWFATLRGRIGYAAGDVLVYGTGGVAYAGLTSSVLGGGGTSDSGTETGYVLGAGIERNLGGGWAAKVEVIQLRFDDVKRSDPSFTSREFDVVQTIGRAGISRRF